MARVRVNVCPTAGLGGSSTTATRSGTRERCGDGLATPSGDGLADAPEPADGGEPPEGATAAEGEATLTATTVEGEATTAGSALGGSGGG
jgi:hypothetical protein